MLLAGKRVVVTGGTGSLGQAIVRRLLSGELGRPDRLTVFSRDEAKQHYMRVSFLHRSEATDDVIYQNSRELLRFTIGDVRDFPALLSAVRDAEVVIHAAALKQVPTCEYSPFEAVQTNLIGTQNLIGAIRDHPTAVRTVIGISTDKACKPINVMGMTKAIMERMLIEANVRCGHTRFGCVRYGNVIASRGSVVPHFLAQIRSGGPVTVTLREMTRFLLTLDQAVETVFAALRTGERGDIYVPRALAARMIDLAEVLIDSRPIAVAFTGIRPGEKIHEIMVSDEECYRTTERDNHYVIQSMLPELSPAVSGPRPLTSEYSSMVTTLDYDGLRRLLAEHVGSLGVEPARA